MYLCIDCNLKYITDRHELYESLHVLEKEKTCPSLSSPENGRVFQLPDGKTAIFTCTSGYTIVGKEVLYCADGKWSPHVPKCISTEAFIDKK